MMQILIFELTSRGLHPVCGTHRSGPIYGNVAIHPLSDRTLRDVSILSCNLCHQGILNELEKFMQRHAAFTIHFFIGDPPADPNAWSAAPNLIGSHGQFIAVNVSLLYPQGFPAGLQQGEISLTHTLAAGVARGLLFDLTPVSVLPLLAQSLNWRARAADGCEINIDSLADLSIAVGSRQVRSAATQVEFPIYGETQYYVEATQGKCGGFGHGLCNGKS